MQRIYLDYNATTPVRPEAVVSMTESLAGEPGNPSSQHHFGRAAAEARELARERVAQAAGCDAPSVIFTSGGTEANNLALRGILSSSGRRHLIVAATEHEAVLQTVEDLAEQGAEITVLPVDGEGRVDPDGLARSIRGDTALVSLMAANNETGVLLPLSRIGEICREKGVTFHSDAVQCFGKSPFAFDALHLDIASISSHKIGGPKGVGALIVRRGVEIRPQVTGGSQERQIRPGTENLPGIVGFGRAAELASEELSAEGGRLSALRDRLEVAILTSVPGARINGGGSPRLPNTANITFPGVSGESLLIALDLEGIAVSTGAACNAGASDPSHVLLAMGKGHDEAQASIRFSLGWGTQEPEIEKVIHTIPGVVARIASAGSTI